jgi:hypothetical protein
MIDLGRYGKVRVAGLPINEAKLALESQVVGGLSARTESTDRVSGLPAPPLVAAGFTSAGPSLSAQAKNEADASVTTRPLEGRTIQDRTGAAYDPVTATIAPGPELTNTRSAGIDRLIFEHARLAQRSGARSSATVQAHGFTKAASARDAGSQSTNHHDPTISVASFSTVDQPLMQAGTSPYHPLTATPVWQASYGGPDPFPSDVASLAAASGSRNDRPQTGSQPKSRWQRLCESVKSLHFPRSSTAGAP